MKRVFLFAYFIFIFIPKIECQVLLPNIPNVTGGSIQAFEYDSLTHKLYIAGDFTQVGTTPRTGFAVIDINTGVVLNDFNRITIDNSNLAPGHYVSAKMQIYKNKLYVGGTFTAMFNSTDSAGFLFALDIRNTDSLRLFSTSAISDFKVYNNKIYITGGYQYGFPAEYMVSELDTMGNTLWQKPINIGANNLLHCLDARNNTLFVGGRFTTLNGIANYNIAKVDLTTHSISSWTLNPEPGIGAGTCFSTNNILALQNDIILNIDQDICATPTYNLASYNITSGALNNSYTKLPFQADFRKACLENDTSFWSFENSGLKLRGIKNYLSTWSPTTNTGSLSAIFRKCNYLFIGGNFTSLEGAAHSGLGIYCLAPNKPVAQTFSSSVCREQKNVTYSVKPDPYATSYTWVYTGTGGTITGSGSAVSLDFSANALSGTLDVFATNACGVPGPVFSFSITTHPLPITKAGADIHFTCSHTIDALSGIPNNSSLASFLWTGPNAYTSTTAYNQVLASNVTGGDYIYTATITATGCSRSDTLKIFFDTLRPVINPLTGNYLLTCQTTSLTLDASANYAVNDTLHWTGPFSFSQNNPAIVTNTGTYYLNITSGANGCKNKDSVVVSQNIITPTFSITSLQDTITCVVDSILLSAASTNTNTIYYWKTPNNDSLQNNSYSNQVGLYFVHAKDTSNGCTSQTTFTISQFTTPPAVNISPGNYQFNCSYSSSILNGSSLTPGATVLWTGPSGFSSNNPATVSQQGTYFLIATNPQNGCTAKDSVLVSLQNILELNISSDTSICNGSSATINVNPIGGTPGFSFSWNNGGGFSSSLIVSPTDTASYIVTVTDNTGCIGTDSVKINVADVLTDSISTFIPCDPNHPSGQVQSFGIGGILPYNYSLNGGTYQSIGVFPNLSFGTYTVSVKDALGCAFQSTAVIDSSSLLPSPDFILSTKEIKGDTFVIVDISNPRPDSVTWILPIGSQIINNNLNAPQIIHSDTGAFQITMLAWFGTCRMSLTKNIQVFNFDTSFANDHNLNGIKDITLYPNPNTGHFTVDVSLYKKQTFAIFIFDALGNELQRLPYSNLDFISAPISISNPTPGTYLLKVITEYDSKTKTFLITQ